MKRKIIPRQKYTTYATFPLVSGDVRAYEIELDLGEDIKGAEFKVTAIRPDGKIIEDIGAVSDGVARYTMAGSMYDVPGSLNIRLSVVHDSSVLTDREIVFEVLEGVNANTSAQTVVPINDSVILRLSAIESKLSQKVDKVSGMGLSSNDFTDGYKEKLENLDEAVGARIEKVSEAVDNTSDSLDEHIKNEENPHNVTASQVGAYTKSETNSLLNQKVNKDDISNVYKFRGSVETEDDLPYVFSVKAIGDAIDEEGNVVGVYDEKTGKITFDYSFTIPVETDKVIKIPCAPITLKPGYYMPTNAGLGIDITVNSAAWPLVYGLASDTNLSVIHSYTDNLIKLSGEVQIKYVTVTFCNYSQNEPVEASVSGTGSVSVDAVKVVFDENPDNWEATQSSNYSPPQNGDVYNVLDTDLNYAWAGTEWDALGGEHKDIEAREQIIDLQTEKESLANKVDWLTEECTDEQYPSAKAAWDNDLAIVQAFRSGDEVNANKIAELEEQMGDIETALDSIIVIQNDLIGGDSE